MKRSHVGRSSRILDVVSLGLLLTGGLLFLSAFAGLESLRKRPYTEFVPSQTELFERTREHARLSRTSYVGLAICGAGIVAALSAAVHAHIIARRKEDVPD